MKSMNRRTRRGVTAMIWTLISIFGIAPLGALAFDRPFFGTWIWRIDSERPSDYE
jgi:hypothetical protein